MGGTKNREEKRKANHVVTSGAGGGGKGPAVVDKRNQELPCPHCDRVFKQLQRYREHIKSKHTDIEGGDREGGGDDTDAASVSGSIALSAASTSAGGMMEVGSKAGYYTSKSPKMILHEWCNRDRRIKPRYKAIAMEDGRFRCKVVLPDTKRPDADTVIWLGDEHAADDAETAEQRGAVAALHQLAGERAFHRILPPEFRNLWEALGEEGKRKEERNAARKAAEEKRQERERARRTAEARRKPVGLIMSDHQQAAIEGALSALRGTGGSALQLAQPTSSTVLLEEGDEAEVQAVARQLQRLGFAEHDVIAALAQEGGRPTVPASLDWLCLHVPHDRLPKRFAAGAASRPVGVLLNKGAATGSYVAASNGAESEDPDVRWLLARGYQASEVLTALQCTGGDRHAAFFSLYSQLTGAELVDSPHEGEEQGGNNAEWQEERTALEAIYDGDVSFPSASCTILRLAMPSDSAHYPLPKQRKPMIDLELRLSTRGLYPAEPPIISVRCPQLPAETLLALTLRLATDAERLKRAPMVHDLAASIEEHLRDSSLNADVAPHVVPVQISDSAPDGSSAEALDRAAAAADILHRTDQHALNSTTPSVRQSTDGARGGGGKKRNHEGLGPRIDVAAESRRLAIEAEAAAKNPRGGSMREARRKLPAFSQRQEALDRLRERTVMVVSGATGCGKSTQVPQFILEEAVAAGTGGACNIVCTQPRRISAVGLAHRVAQERGEQVGAVVGYTVRLDSKRSARTRLLFCTTGVLLRRMLGDPSLVGTTHVIVDEVHERSVDSDMLLLLLRDLVASGRAPHLRIVLMSATADAELFARYFTSVGGAQQGVGHSDPRGAILTIPGFTHPVRDLYLEDVLERTCFNVGKGSRWAKRGTAQASFQGPETGRSSAGQQQMQLSKDIAAAKLPAGFRAGDTPPVNWDEDAAEQSMDSNLGGGYWDGGGGRGGAKRQLQGLEAPPPDEPYSDATMRSLENIDEAQLNYDLVEALVTHIVEIELKGGPAALLSGWSELSRNALAAVADGDGGKAPGAAILIFMTGAEEINRTVRALRASQRLHELVGGSNGLLVLPLHGGLPPAQQSKVFERPPPGVRKIVVATNVAETSITIDDVTCVIDAGRVKELGYDTERGIARLQETWVSQAAAQQRRGRAGRVRPGVCFRLFSRATWNSLQPQQEPEMLRVPLESVIMTVKAIFGATAPAQGVLGRALTPPEPAAVSCAVAALKALGALYPTEELAPLGRHLTLMPLDPRVGKMLIFGALLRCASPVLTMAAAMGHGRQIFYSPSDKRQEAQEAKRKLATAVAGAKSDHLLTVVAFNSWLALRQRDGRRAASTFCADYFVSEQAMDAILDGRAEYAAILADLGFVPGEYVQHTRQGGLSAGLGGGAGPKPFTGAGGLDEYAGNARVIKAALCAGFYPSILRVEHPTAKYKSVGNGAFQVDPKAIALRYFDRVKGRVFQHPASINFDCGRFESGWLVYTDLIETSKIFVRESSMVPVYSVLLFGGEITVLHEKGLLKVDGWAEFRAPARVGVLVRELRQGIATLLQQKIENPGFDLAHAPIVDAMHQLLATDGF